MFTFTEILFGSLGRIKKVKIYTTPLGKQKGDALITFALSECAITACFKVRFQGCMSSVGDMSMQIGACIVAMVSITFDNQLRAL